MQRHPADLISLIFGVLFAGAGSLMLVDRLDLLTQARWILPLLLIVLALAMLASASWSARRRDGDGEAAD
jgi:cytochrome c oxidase subunit IV